MIEDTIRKEHFDREQNAKQLARDTKKDLADVNMAGAAMIEDTIRKEQFDREQDAKQTARETIKDLADVNMAGAVRGDCIKGATCKPSLTLVLSFRCPRLGYD